MTFITRRPGGRLAIAAPMAVSATWLQWWTLDHGDEQPVVGEAYHLHDLLQVCGGRTPDGPRIKLATAQLVMEPRNPHDRNAVAVLIGGTKVGYLPRGDAPGFHHVIRFLSDAGQPATCRARFTGAWDRGPRDRGHVGVVLDVRLEPRPLRPSPAFLPCGRSVTVVDEEEHQELLAGFLGHHHLLETVALLGGLDDRQRLGVYLGGHLVGRLTPKMTERYLPLASYVHHAGFPPSCEAVIMRGDKKVEVQLSLCHPTRDL